MPQDSLNFTLDPDWYAKETEFWSELILPPGIVDLHRTTIVSQVETQRSQLATNRGGDCESSTLARFTHELRTVHCG